MSVEKIRETAKTQAFDRDLYARRQLEQLTETTNGIVEASPFVKLWSSKTLAVGTTLSDLTPEDFDPVDGMPKSIEGATKIVITIEGIRSSASGSLYGNKGISYKIIDTDDKICAWYYDTNIQVSHEVFKAMPDMDGTYFSEMSCFTAQDTNYVNVTSNNAIYYSKAIGHRETGEVMVKPLIKNFIIHFSTNAAVYNEPMKVSVYVSFD